MVQRRRRWTNVKPTLNQRLVSAGEVQVYDRSIMLVSPIYLTGEVMGGGGETGVGDGRGGGGWGGSLGYYAG